MFRSSSFPTGFTFIVAHPYHSFESKCLPLNKEYVAMNEQQKKNDENKRKKTGHEHEQLNMYVYEQ